MDIQSNKNFYILLLLFAALVAGILAILYIHSQKKQKAFENAINELKEEALKYMKNQIQPPFSEYKEVTQEEEKEQTEGQEGDNNKSLNAEITHQVELALPQFVVTTTAKPEEEEELNSSSKIPADEQIDKKITSAPVKEKAQIKSKTIQKKSQDKKQEVKLVVEKSKKPTEEPKAEDTQNNNN